ncbi:hypothetical protein BpHYR1_041621 [Brachionus plicatilis]|uniref:Uncharacterized protein n=1 Tax=Brachionus plicatilis TaxID=10195 RepID=A0A3M7RH68_BRAPC|nr:hypothetical protein BpHYR1_041621 [Brachionus plicatilis]
MVCKEELNDQKIDINGLLKRSSETKRSLGRLEWRLSPSFQPHDRFLIPHNTHVNSYMSLLKTDHSSSVILDIGKYLDNTIKKIRCWKSFEIQKIIHLFKKNYEENLDVNDVKESTKAIKYIEERIDILTLSLDNNIITIFDEIANQTIGSININLNSH